MTGERCATCGHTRDDHLDRHGRESRCYGNPFDSDDDGSFERCDCSRFNRGEMTPEEHGRWFRLVCYFILWTVLCGLAAAYLLQPPPRSWSAPLPFPRDRAWSKHPPGEYERVWTDPYGDRIVARMVIREDGTATHWYVSSTKRGGYLQELEWRINDRGDLLLTNDGRVIFWFDGKTTTVRRVR